MGHGPQLKKHDLRHEFGSIKQKSDASIFTNQSEVFNLGEIRIQKKNHYSRASDYALSMHFQFRNFHNDKQGGTC